MVAYPAIIHEENGAYWAEFPDMEGCFTNGGSVAETLENAAEALGMHVCSLYDRGIEVKSPTDIRSMEAPKDGFVSMVVADPYKYKKDTRAVKKTLTIQAWLNKEAEKKGINFSAALQKALIALIQ